MVSMAGMTPFEHNVAVFVSFEYICAQMQAYLPFTFSECHKEFFNSQKTISALDTKQYIVPRTTNSTGCFPQEEIIYFMCAEQLSNKVLTLWNPLEHP
jgi:hypothetical protein